MDTNEDSYRLKKIQWRGNTIPIIMQNINGPCPLLAICNILLLKGSICIHPDYSCVTYEKLVILLGDLLLNTKVQLSQSMEENYNQNVADAIALFPTLQHGLDINVCFRSITSCEFTKELAVFDLFNIRLVHGWLVDPQDKVAFDAISNLSYNEVVERLVHLSTARDDKSFDQSDPAIQQELQIERFMNETQSQLSVHGLMELHVEIQEGEFCVFFRNNHFSVLHKHKGDLFLLVTDQGYLYKNKIIWELLNEVGGDSFFYDSNFDLYNPEQDTPEKIVQEAEMMDDEQLALQLQREEELLRENSADELRRQQLLADEEFAKQIAQQEQQVGVNPNFQQNFQQAAPTPAPAPQPTQPPPQLTPEQLYQMLFPRLNK